MRRNKTMSLAEVLQDYVKKMHFEDKLLEVNALNAWESVVGQTITKHTKIIYIKEGVLFVKLDSSVVRNELAMLKQPLMKKINETVGAKVVSDIVLK